MPKPNENILEFKHYNHYLKVHFVVYADFECIHQKIQTCQPSDEIRYTNYILITNFCALIIIYS